MSRMFRTVSTEMVFRPFSGPTYRMSGWFPLSAFRHASQVLQGRSTPLLQTSAFARSFASAIRSSAVPLSRTQAWGRRSSATRPRSFSLMSYSSSVTTKCSPSSSETGFQKDSPFPGFGASTSTSSTPAPVSSKGFSRMPSSPLAASAAARYALS